MAANGGAPVTLSYVYERGYTRCVPMMEEALIWRFPNE